MPPIPADSQMRQNLSRRAHSLARLKFAETFGRLPHRFTASIGERGERMPQQFLLRIAMIGMNRNAHADKITLGDGRRKVWPGRAR